MGTNYIAPTWRQPENLNKDKLSNYSLDFDGASVIDCGTISALNGGIGAFSISVWFNYTGTPITSTHMLLSGGTGTTNRIYIQLISTDKIRYAMGGGYHDSDMGTLTSGVWYNLITVQDGTNVNIYLNGVLKDSFTEDNPTSNFATNLRLGNYISGSYRWNGKMSQCSLFDYALTDGTGGTVDQITYLYNLNNPMAISGAEPVAYWPLGDNSNPTADAGYPNIVSAADSVFNFDGTDKINCGPASEYSKVTLSAWVNPNNPVFYAGIFGTRNGTTPVDFPYALTVNNTKRFRFLISGSTQIISDNQFVDGIWHHVVGVFDGTTLKMYVNGELQAGIVTSSSVSTTTNDLMIGAQWDTDVQYEWKGDISNAQIWDNDLSEAEVKALYNNGLPLSELSEIPQNNNLQGWYKLNQSAVLTPGITALPWVVSVATGSPDYSSGADGAYTLNGEFRCRDTRAYDFSRSFYLTFRTITGAHNNITLTSTGGYKNRDGGIRLQYRIDGGSWVQFQEVDGSGTGAWTFTAPSSVNCNTSYELRAQMHGSAYPDSYISLYDMTISASSGTLLTETFGQTNYTGAHGGSISNPPPATISTDEWDIPDNRSAYPQSFGFLGSEKVVVDENFFTLTGANKMQVCTISFWVRITKDGYKGVIGLNSSTNWTLRIYQGNFWFVSGGNNYIKWLNVNQGINLQDGKWHHCLMTIPTADNKDDCNLFLDGLKMSNALGDRTIYGAASGGSGAPMSALIVGAWLGLSGVNISNVQVWLNTALSDPEALSVYNNGIPLISNSIQPSSSKALFNFDKITSAWDGTNWIIENQIYPANYFKAIDTTIYGGFKTSSTSLSDFMGSSVTNFTWSMWVRNTSGDTGSSSLASWSYPNSGGYKDGIQQWYGNLSLWGSASNKILFGSINDGLWKHVLIAVDLTAGADWDDCVKCFINGQTRAMTSSVGTPPTSMDWTAAGTNQRAIGVGVGYGVQHSFHGDISNYTLYNSTLGQTEATALFNNGTPVTSAVGSPTAWWKINNLTTGLEDVSGNSYNIETYGGGQVEVDTFVSAEAGVSSEMTQSNLVDNNVSTVNGESDTLPGTALVQSDLTRKLPFSNYSIQLDGLDYFKYTGTDFEFGDGTNDTSFSVSTWVKLDGIGSTWVSCGSTTQRRYRLGTRGTGILTFELYSNNTSSNSLVFDSTSISLLTPETWYNVIASYNAANTTLKLFIDGQEVVGTLTNNSYTAMGTGSTEMNFGRFFSNGTSYTEGWISNFCFYKQIISDEEALDIYNNGIPLDLSSSFTPGTPYAWFPMDQKYTYFNGSVLVARDKVGSLDLEGVNVIQSDIIGDAPGSTSNGVGSNLTIADLKGDMQNSINNSYSINMADYADGVINPANSGRSTNVP